MNRPANLREGAVSAVQWVVTVFYLAFIVFAFVGWYLSTTRDSFFYDGTWIFGVLFAVALVAGFAWGRRNPDDHRNRIEVVVWLFVAGFVLSMLPSFVLSLLGLTVFDVPFFVVPLTSYGLTLVVAYGVVYGLDLQLFLPEESVSLRDEQ